MIATSLYTTHLISTGTVRHNIVALITIAAISTAHIRYQHVSKAKNELADIRNLQEAQFLPEKLCTPLKTRQSPSQIPLSKPIRRNETRQMKTARLGRDVKPFHSFEIIFIQLLKCFTPFFFLRRFYHFFRLSYVLFYTITYVKSLINFNNIFIIFEYFNNLYPRFIIK